MKSVWVDAGAGDDRVEYASGRPILTDRADGATADGYTGARNDTVARAFPLNDAAGFSRGLSGDQLVTGLTLDGPSDEDWFSFSLATKPIAGSRLHLTSVSPLDRITVRITDTAGQTVRSLARV